MRMNIIDRHDDPRMFRVVTETIVLRILLRTIQRRLTDQFIRLEINDRTEITTDVNEDFVARMAQRSEIRSVNRQFTRVTLQHRFQFVDQRVSEIDQRRRSIEMI